MTYPIEEIRSRLFASVLSDCLDQAGYTKQALSSRIRPLDEASVMVGRARTAAFMEVYHVAEGVNPYELEIALIDSLQADEIPVFACSNPARVAPWGELLSTASRVRGAAGALMDGCVRDIKPIKAMGFPVFHGGIAPLDSRGRGKIMALDVPIECDGVAVHHALLGEPAPMMVLQQISDGLSVTNLAALIASSMACGSWPSTLAITCQP